MIINAVSVNYTQVTILPPFKNFYTYTHLRKSNSHDQVMYTNTFEIYVFYLLNIHIRIEESLIYNLISISYHND